MNGIPETQPETTSIVKYEGTPNEPFRAKEQSRWRQFLRAIWPFAQEGGKWAQYGTDLGRTFAEAEVADRVNRAEKTAAETAEIAASADLKRQESVRVFNTEIDSIFAQDNLPDSAKMLKLAKLFEANPELVQQVDRVTHILERLTLQRGAKVAFQLPPPDEDVD